MATDRVRTANYPESARKRLGRAVQDAREAMMLSRPQFVKRAKAVGVKLNVRSLELVENGEPGVGHAFLVALGRVLPGWTDQTPRSILDGGPIPPMPTREQPEEVARELEVDGRVIFKVTAEDEARWRRMTPEQILDEAGMIGRLFGMVAQEAYLRAVRLARGESEGEQGNG